MYILTENFNYMKIKWNDLQECCTNYPEFNQKHVPRSLHMDIMNPSGYWQLLTRTSAITLILNQCHCLVNGFLFIQILDFPANRGLSNI